MRVVVEAVLLLIAAPPPAEDTARVEDETVGDLRREGEGIRGAACTALRRASVRVKRLPPPPLLPPAANCCCCCSVLLRSALPLPSAAPTPSAADRRPGLRMVALPPGSEASVSPRGEVRAREGEVMPRLLPCCWSVSSAARVVVGGVEVVVEVRSTTGRLGGGGGFNCGGGAKESSEEASSSVALYGSMVRKAEAVLR